MSGSAKRPPSSRQPEQADNASSGSSSSSGDSSSESTEEVSGNVGVGLPASSFEGLLPAAHVVSDRVS